MIERSSDRAIEGSSDRVIESSPRVIERPSDRATVRSSDRAIDRSSDRTQALERPSDRAIELTIVFAWTWLDVFASLLVFSNFPSGFLSFLSSSVFFYGFQWFSVLVFYIFSIITVIICFPWSLAVFRFPWFLVVQLAIRLT